jgi:hypothetical protein
MSYTFNPDLKLTFGQAKQLKVIHLKGVKMAQNSVGNVEITNPEQLTENSEILKGRLVELYYSIPSADSLPADEVEEMYKPIEDLDPLKLKKTQNKTNI